MKFALRVIESFDPSNWQSSPSLESTTNSTNSSQFSSQNSNSSSLLSNIPIGLIGCNSYRACTRLGCGCNDSRSARVRFFSGSWIGINNSKGRNSFLAFNSNKAFLRSLSSLLASIPLRLRACFDLRMSSLTAFLALRIASSFSFSSFALFF